MTTQVDSHGAIAMPALAPSGRDRVEDSAIRNTQKGAANDTLPLKCATVVRPETKKAVILGLCLALLALWHFVVWPAVHWDPDGRRVRTGQGVFAFGVVAIFGPWLWRRWRSRQ